MTMISPPAFAPYNVWIVAQIKEERRGAAATSEISYWHSNTPMPVRVARRLADAMSGPHLHAEARPYDKEAR